MVYYWNLVRPRFPNIQVRLQQIETFSASPSVALGPAMWLSCSLEDKCREKRLYCSQLYGHDLSLDLCTDCLDSQ
ncbi:hypothetical protein PCC8801_0577 [Rippkaea orientalis PCC 8801]|uniref:Uncharacterized protein n=2 Tax=Rippkaea TaxID=2546365 RepID=B7JVU5_RIPO1|nr:hypothetical protein PCC8801_0577 [Rippkaea orientalis PCC 8801]